MRWAMMARILVIGTTCGAGGVLGGGAPGAVVAAAGITVDGVLGTWAGVGGAAKDSAEPRCSMWRSTSSLVMRPLEPVPEMRDRSRWFSLAMRRTRGEERSPSVRTEGAGWASSAGGGIDAGDGGAAARASVAAGLGSAVLLLRGFRRAVRRQVRRR